MIDGFRFVWTNIHPRISVKKILCVHNEKGYHVLINLGISRSQDLNRGTNISRPSWTIVAGWSLEVGALSSPFKGQASPIPLFEVPWGATINRVCRLRKQVQWLSFRGDSVSIFLHRLFCERRIAKLNDEQSRDLWPYQVGRAESDYIFYLGISTSDSHPTTTTNHNSQSNSHQYILCINNQQTSYFLLINLSALSPFSFVGCTHRIWLWITCHLHRNLSFFNNLLSSCSFVQQCQLQPLFSTIDSLAAQHQHSQEEPALITGCQNSLKTYPLSPGRVARVHIKAKNQTNKSKEASVHIKAKKWIKPIFNPKIKQSNLKKMCMHI